MKIKKSKTYNFDLKILKKYTKDTIKYIRNNYKYTIYLYYGILGIQKEDLKSEKMEIEIFHII